MAGQGTSLDDPMCPKIMEKGLICQLLSWKREMPPGRHVSCPCRTLQDLTVAAVLVGGGRQEGDSGGPAGATSR